MTLDEARQFHQHALADLTLATQGIEAVSRSVEVFNARGGSAEIESLKYATPQTEHEEAVNAAVDDILDDLQTMGAVATKLKALFVGADRAAMMKLRTDI